ncbi:helix-turn-helix domain-containing protein [Kerstersia gyiorum]|uniref:helix-turn-helix domain-containing protein n=1 Tax=Kerstersia gyiorum TaxID=206506 RepID=UPI001EE76ADD|nr:XRE family transcriptional regulator [Kerstersia gyiorum]
MPAPRNTPADTRRATAAAADRHPDAGQHSGGHREDPRYTLIDLPFRLRTLRRQHQLSLAALALRTSLTRSYLSKLERGLSNPSDTTIEQLAHAYGLTRDQLLGSGPEGLDEIVSVVRVADRQPMIRTGSSLGYQYQALAGKRRIRSMQPVVVVPPREFPDRQAAQPHEGEEFMLVIHGAVELMVGSRVWRLESGDAVYFDATLPHRMRTVSRQDAEVLVVGSR